MRRTMLYSVMLCLLLGVDVAANHAAITRDILRAATGVGKSATHVVHATVGFMVGR